MKLFSGTKEQPMTQETNGPTPPMIQPIRRPRPLSDVAAQAAQHVNDLEVALEDAVARLGEATNRINLLEQRCQMLETDRREMEHERDYHKRLHVLIEASLRNSATILLDCLREPAPAPAPEASKQIEAVAATLEAELTFVEPTKANSNGNGNKKSKTVTPDTNRNVPPEG